MGKPKVRGTGPARATTTPYPSEGAPPIEQSGEAPPPGYTRTVPRLTLLPFSYGRDGLEVNEPAGIPGKAKAKEKVSASLLHGAGHLPGCSGKCGIPLYAEKDILRAIAERFGAPPSRSDFFRKKKENGNPFGDIRGKVGVWRCALLGWAGIAFPGLGK